MMNVGTYFGKPIKWGVSEEGSKKTPAFWCEFEITHFAVDGKWQSVVEVVQRTVYSYLSDAAFEFSQEKLSTCLGFNGDFQNPEISEEAKNGITLECEHQTYNGKQQERWNYPGGQRQRQPADNATIRRMNALWKKGQSTNSGDVPEPANVSSGLDNPPF